MSCIKWRKTYRKAVNISPNTLEYLAQLSWIKGSWIVVTIVAGDNTAEGGKAALWSVPIHSGLVDNDWRIVPTHQDFSDSGLRLEIKVTDSIAQLRLVNKIPEETLTWVNITILVLSQDDPTIQEMQGVGNSSVSLYYLPQDSLGGFDPAELEARITTLEGLVADLTTELATQVSIILNLIDVERNARLAMLGKLNRLWDGTAGYYEPVTNGDAASPEIIFDGGDVVMAWVPAA